MASSSSDHAAAVAAAATAAAAHPALAAPAVPLHAPSLQDVFFVLLKDMKWGSRAHALVDEHTATVRSSDATLMVCPAPEPLCDAHLASTCVKLARGYKVRVDGVSPQCYSFDAPSLLFEKVGKLGNIGKGFVRFNCKDTHYLKVFVYVGKLI